MRTLGRSLLALLLGSGLAKPAIAAETRVALSVERSAEAAGCPTSSELGARLAAVRGRPENPADAPYRVEFTRTGGAFHAIIRAADGSSRRIESRGESCASLGEATAVTLALLLDAEPQPQPSAAPPAASPAPAPSVESTRTAPPPDARRVAEKRIRLALAAGSLFGVIRPAAPVLGAEASLELGPFRAGLGGLWALPQALSLGAGTVHELLFAVTARACFALSRWQSHGSPGARLDVCSGLYVGAQRAEASGFTTNERRTRNWLAIPAELALSHDFGGLGLELSGAALFPLVRNEFVVDGQGTAYSAAPVSGLLALRVFVALPW